MSFLKLGVEELRVEELGVFEVKEYNEVRPHGTRSATPHR